jgi:hypothetical protein
MLACVVVERVAGMGFKEPLVGEGVAITGAYGLGVGFIYTICNITIFFKKHLKLAHC